MSLDQYKARSGRIVPVWTIEIQTVPDDVDKILDAIMKVHPLAYGRYRRNASVSAVGMETSSRRPGRRAPAMCRAASPARRKAIRSSS
jgi:hypothetical protein